ncbi:aminopeptidase N [Desulfoluna sp.]|uniref:aminopeptidase N n=1 Tax=Desulfoluna sp. TaxID=2045199 RepID=UPI002638FB16|nr:aminopeptidase N [Desulfoluna sp.]
MTEPVETRLKDYKRPDFSVETVDLHVDIFETETLVSTTLTVHKSPAAVKGAPFVLDGREVTLLSIEIDGRVLSEGEYTLEGEVLTVLAAPGAFTLKTRVKIHPEENTSLEGLYFADGTFLTQCEAEGFRRLTFFPDRPDVMSSYRCTVAADRDKYPVLLANGNLVDEGELDGGRHFATWEDPHKKPCYLFAMVAGDLACLEDRFTTFTGREVALKFYVDHQDADKCDHAIASLKKSMKWDEETFGLSYDLDTYMVVATHSFNAGAMENKGLNVFNSKYVLAKPETATDMDFQNIEGVIGHEYFHNWTGNRVTLCNWFQLSLKEGLTVFRDQEFSSDMGSRAVKRISDVRVLRAAQFPEDAGPMAHPIRPESYIEMNNFYTATVYNKGAEVIRMIHTFLGPEGFRKGMDLYVARHDGNAVACEDFVKAMEDASGVDLSRFRLWYSQAGTPDVTVDRAFDAEAKRYTLTLTQKVPDTPGQSSKKAMQIPVKIGFLGKDGAPIALTLEGEASSGPIERVLNFSADMESFTFTGVDEEPVPSLFRGFSAPINKGVNYTEAELIFLMGNDPDPFNRWDAAQQLFADTILDMVAGLKEGTPLTLSEPLVDAVKKTLTHETLDKALIAQALTLPSETELGDRMAAIDVDGIHAAREFVIHTLAETLKESWKAVYEACHEEGVYCLDPESMATRRLKSLCLTYLARVESPAFIFEAFTAATNMTDGLAALTVLAGIDAAEGDRAVDSFYASWKGDTLVLDKWFTAQATSNRPGALERVMALTDHPAFDVKNPNKVRALIGAFCQANPWHFHRMDGKGYDLLADTVIALNTINPSIAARMASGFNRWKRYDKTRQALMKARLERIKTTENLANGVYEIVSKALM